MFERRQSYMMMTTLVLVSSLIGFVAGAAGWFPRAERIVQIVQLYSGGGEERAAEGLNLEQMQKVQHYIQQQYLESVPPQKLTQGALKGMVESIGDRYSSYFTPTEYQRYVESFESSFSGIGVYIETSAKTNLVTVISPIKGGPGEQAGLLAGDAIVAVDDKDITRLTLDQAVSLIRGPKGTKVKLTVQRPDVEELLQFTIVRATISIPSIEHEMLDQQEGIGYIHVREFNKEIAARVDAALKDLEGKGMKRLVFDLRQNPGGLLDEAVDMASLFVPANQPILHVVNRSEKQETYESNGQKKWKLPMVVLIDGGSASASEIVAGALKDHKIGVLMGAKTFGKGVVQSFFDLGEIGGLKLTTSKYLTAGGHSIHEKGIEPDVAVENPQKVTLRSPEDAQLAAAIRHVKTLKP